MTEAVVRKRCKAAMAGTNYILEDSSEKGIESKLYAAYRRILDKSTRKVSNCGVLQSLELADADPVHRTSIFMFLDTQAASSGTTTRSPRIAKTRYSITSDLLIVHIGICLASPRTTSTLLLRYGRS